jgi:hypothetical protein
MSFFRSQTLPVIRNTGTYIKGVWTKTPGTDTTIRCTVQPTTGEKILPLLQGRRIESLVEIITDTDLKITDPKNQVQGDIVQWQGKNYELVFKLPWQNGLINHYEYIAISEKEGV